MRSRGVQLRDVRRDRPAMVSTVLTPAHARHVAAMAANARPTRRSDGRHRDRSASRDRGPMTVRITSTERWHRTLCEGPDCPECRRIDAKLAAGELAEDIEHQ